MSLTLHSSERRLIVELASDKVGKLLDAFAEIKAAKGMISTARLRHLAGLLSWISNLVPSAIQGKGHSGHAKPTRVSVRG